MPVEEAVHPRAFLAYLAALVAVSGLALWSVGPMTAFDPATLAGAFLLMALAEVAAVKLPGGGALSARSAIDLASIVVMGPLAAAWSGLLATFAAQGVIQRRPALLVIHDLAARPFVVLAAGGMYGLAGGRPGAVTLPADLGAMAAAAATYFVGHSLLASLALGWSGVLGPLRAWQRVFGRGLLFHLACLALGALVGVLVIRIGPWVLLLVAPPVVAAHSALRGYVGIRADLRDFVRALAGVLDEVDPYTRQHSVRVAEYSLRLARGLGCPESVIDDLECAALVHDLGKIGPQNQRILQKPGTLSHEDQRTLRSHPATGAGIVGKVDALRSAAEIVRLHHERPDGRGYPLGLRSSEVPVGARILNVADAFDAMTSDRPYRRALDVETAVRELDRGAGSQFDREVVDCLLRLHASGRFAKIESPSSEELQLLKLRPRRVSV